MHKCRFSALLVFAMLAGVGLAPQLATASILALPYGAQPVNVSVGFNTRVPLEDSNQDALAATQKAGRDYLYRLARDECAALKATVAKTCRLTNLNINTQIQQHKNPPPLLYINGNASFTITLKDDPPGDDSE